MTPPLRTVRIRHSFKPGFRPGRTDRPDDKPLRSGEPFINFADGVMLFGQDERTLSVMSMNVGLDGLWLRDAPPPASSDDPAGMPGDVLFSGGFMYRRTAIGWLRFAGETF